MRDRERVGGGGGCAVEGKQGRQRETKRGVGGRRRKAREGEETRNSEPRKRVKWKKKETRGGGRCGERGWGRGEEQKLRNMDLERGEGKRKKGKKW